VVKIRIHTKDASDMDRAAEEVESEEINKTDKLTSEMCNILQGTGATVNMDNYYMSTTAAIHLKEKGVLCRGTIRTNRKFIPKSVLFMAKECRSNERGTSRIAINAEHSLVAIGWLDNKAINFISTVDTTGVVSVERRIKNEKVQLFAPAVVKNYNMYMGGVDRHDKLRSTFSLGKQLDLLQVD
jgi:C1A family cysteine protease